MRLADTNRAGEQQSGSSCLQRIALDELFRSKMRRAQRSVGGGEVRLVAFQRAMLVTPGDMRPPQHPRGPSLDPADAILGKLPAVLLHHPQTRSTANRTNFTHSRPFSIAAPESKCLLCESWIYLD